MYKTSVTIILVCFVIGAFLILSGEKNTPLPVVETSPAMEEPAMINTGVVVPGQGIDPRAEMETEVQTMESMSPVMVDEPEVMPVPRPQAKIDVRIACESALTYTSFTDGAAAEAYVAECIEGKHPEVIERFISDMGVDGAVI
jgi:hypothetical protein